MPKNFNPTCFIHNSHLDESLTCSRCKAEEDKQAREGNPPVGYEQYLCKFDHKCKRKGLFNPATYLYYKKSKPLNPCTHGGGIGCRFFKIQTNINIGWYRPYPIKRRSWENPDPEPVF